MSNRNETIAMYEGNVVIKTFNLRIPRSTAPWDVSLATQILLEVERSSDGEKLTPIAAVDSDPGADWSAGRVPVTIDTTVTGTIGTYRWSITIFIGGQEITADDGTIEVFDRPGYPIV